MSVALDATTLRAENKRLSGILRLARKLHLENKAEIARLSEALHAVEAHPDYEYAHGNSLAGIGHGWTENVHWRESDGWACHAMRKTGAP